MNQRTLCIIKDIKKQEIFQKSLESYDSSLSEVQLIELSGSELSVFDLLAWQDSFWPNREKEYSYHFFTNLPEVYEFARNNLSSFFQSFELYEEEAFHNLVFHAYPVEKQGFIKSFYPYDCFLDELNCSEIQQISDFFSKSTEDLYVYAENFSQMTQYCIQFSGWMQERPYFQRLSILQSLEYKFSKKYQRVFFYSLYLTLLPEAEYTLRLLELIQEDEKFTWQNQFFLYYQILSLSFTTPSLRNTMVNEKLTLLYHKIVQRAKKDCALYLPYLKAEDRNPKLAVMLISQFLTLNHGPTKTALDRCEVLIKNLGMEVVLINTAEMVPSTGMLPLADRQCAGYIESLSDKRTYRYKDLEIPFLQCSSRMPDTKEMQEIIQAVYALKPRFIINIGGNSPTNDILDDFLPTITISTVPSGLTSLEGNLQVIGRCLNSSDLKVLEKFGKNKKNVIEGSFTWSFKPQITHFTRKELKLPENSFILAVIGARLTEELTNEFVEMLLRAADKNTLVVFIGHCYNFDSYKGIFPDFSSKVQYLDFQDDILAVLECCSLYVNPKRTGGGGSVVEAMFKGLPVVTLPGGDVGLAAGTDFHVRDYSDMEKTIKKYREDPVFYQEMSQKALLRAKAVTDSAGQFTKILKEAEKRILEFEALK